MNRLGAVPYYINNGVLFYSRSDPYEIKKAEQKEARIRRLVDKFTETNNRSLELTHS